VIYIINDGIGITIAQVGLASEFISALIRIVFNIDNNTRRVYNNVVTYCLGSLPLPFIIITTLLFTLYWQELLSKNAIARKQTGFLTKLKIPFIVTCIVLMFCELGFIITIIFFSSQRVLSFIATLCLYMFLDIVITVYYLVVVIRLLKYMKKRKRHNNFVWVIFICIFMNALSLLLILLGEIGLVLSVYFNYYTDFYFQLFLWITYLGFNITSLSHIVAFKPWKRLPSQSKMN